MEGRRKMSEIKDGGAAFPYCVWVGDHHNGHNTGMSMREWFAGMALHGILQLHGSVVGGPERTAKMSYEVADAMIRAGKGEK